MTLLSALLMIVVSWLTSPPSAATVTRYFSRGTQQGTSGTRP
jgi:hypothetical protein